MSQTRRTFVAGAAAFSFAAGRAPVFAQQRLTPIRIVVTPVTNYTGLLVGRDKGWFEEQGLNVSWSPVAQTAIAVEATYGGSVEFAGGGVLEPMIARGNGLDIMLVVPSARIRPEAPDNSAIVVKANSAIQKPADLAGKRASVMNFCARVNTVRKRFAASALALSQLSLANIAVTSMFGMFSWYG